jgi:hypothetical protein
MCSVWVLMVAFPVPLGLPWEGAFIEGVPELSWAANNSAKLGSGAAGQVECWTVMSSRDFGAQHKVRARRLRQLPAAAAPGPARAAPAPPHLAAQHLAWTWPTAAALVGVRSPQLVQKLGNWTHPDENKARPPPHPLHTHPPPRCLKKTCLRGRTRRSRRSCWPPWPGPRACRSSGSGRRGRGCSCGAQRCRSTPPTRPACSTPVGRAHRSAAAAGATSGAFPFLWQPRCARCACVARLAPRQPVDVPHLCCLLLTRGAVAPPPLLPEARMGICGDWLVSPCVEGAALSGIALAEKIAAQVRRQASPPAHPPATPHAPAPSIRSLLR